MKAYDQIIAERMIVKTSKCPGEETFTPGPYRQAATNSNGRNTMNVFVKYNNLDPAMPTTPKRARQMLAAGKVAVYRMIPFTIILKDRSEGLAQPVRHHRGPSSAEPRRTLRVNGEQR